LGRRSSLISLQGGVGECVIGNALTLRILAFILFSQPAGVITEHVNRKKILIAAGNARFSLLTLFPFITAVRRIYSLFSAINVVKYNLHQNIRPTSDSGPSGAYASTLLMFSKRGDCDGREGLPQPQSVRAGVRPQTRTRP
jgi:hypothetical protein